MQEALSKEGSKEGYDAKAAAVTSPADDSKARPVAIMVSQVSQESQCLSIV